MKFTHYLVLTTPTEANLFTKLDANSGFWQVPLSESLRLLTTPFGRYCFNKLPFGITRAPEVFHKRMNSLLQGLDGTVRLIDDISIFSRDCNEQKERLIRVLRTLKEAGVTLNLEKCEFYKERVMFLGHLIDSEGIRLDPGKTKATCQMSQPKNISELKRFLGMANQLGKFSRNLAELTQSLCKLLSIKSVWQWTPAQENAFKAIKEEL